MIDDARRPLLESSRRQFDMISIVQHAQQFMMAILSLAVLLVIILDTLLIEVEPTIFRPRFQIHFFGPLFNSRYMQLVPASFVLALALIII